MKKKLMIIFAFFVLVSFVGVVYAECPPGYSADDQNDKLCKNEGGNYLLTSTNINDLKGKNFEAPADGVTINGVKVTGSGEIDSNGNIKLGPNGQLTTPGGRVIKGTSTGNTIYKNTQPPQIECI